jgi:hypothetical protein
MVKRCLLGMALLVALSVPSSAQQVYDPGNGVTLPAVIKEVHLMGPIGATVGISCVVTTDGIIGAATVAASPDPKLNDVAIRAFDSGDSSRARRTASR